MAEVLQVLESLPTKTDSWATVDPHRVTGNGPPLQRDLYLYGFMENETQALKRRL